MLSEGVELNQWGRPVFRPHYIGFEERDNVTVYKFTRPPWHVSNTKVGESRGYVVGFVSCFNNLYVEYVVVDRNIHPDPAAFMRRRLHSLVGKARTNGWNKRLTAEIEALALLV